MIWNVGICLICFGLCLPLYMHYKTALKLPLACAYKSLGTLCAFLPALIAAIRLDPQCWICAAAILIYASADTLLEYNLMFGAGIFMAGHILYSAFFLGLAHVSTFHLIGFLFFAAISGYTLWKCNKLIGKYMPAFIVYGISMLFMCVSALACFMLGSSEGILFACGGALFYVSDFIFFRRTLFPSSKALDWIYITTHYCAVLLFGIACLLL